MVINARDDMDRAADIYTRLGFTLTERGNPQPDFAAFVKAGSAHWGAIMREKSIKAELRMELASQR
ncbi:MAG: hypothetical protein ACXWKQ_07680 [Reyranella sp.]